MSSYVMRYNAYGHECGKEPRLAAVIKLRPGEALDVVRADAEQPSLKASYADWGPSRAVASYAGLTDRRGTDPNAPTPEERRKYRAVNPVQLAAKARWYRRQRARIVANSRYAVQSSGDEANPMGNDRLAKRRRPRHARLEANVSAFSRIKAETR